MDSFSRPRTYSTSNSSLSAAGELLVLAGRSSVLTSFPSSFGPPRLKWSRFWASPSRVLGLISNSVRHLTLCGRAMEGTASVPSETRRVLSRVNRPAHRRNQGLPGHAIVVLDRHLDTRRGPTRGGDPDPGQAWHAAAASRGSGSAPLRSISPTLTPPKEQRGAPWSPQHPVRPPRSGVGPS